MTEDQDQQLKALDATLTSVERVLDLDVLRKEQAELEERASDPDLWSDQEQAQQVTSRLSYVKADISRVTDLRRRLDDLPALRACRSRG